MASDEVGPEVNSHANTGDTDAEHPMTMVGVPPSPTDSIAEVVPPRPRRGADDPPTAESYAVNGLVLPVPAYIREMIDKHRKTA